MSANDTPCRVLADLRRHEENDRVLDLASYMDQAREELIEKLMSGKQVDRHDFIGILDSELNNNVRATVEDVALHLLDIVDYAKDDCVHGERRARLHQWMLGLVERYVDSKPELVEEHAAELEAIEAEEQQEE